MSAMTPGGETRQEARARDLAQERDAELAELRAQEGTAPTQPQPQGGGQVVASSTGDPTVDAMLAGGGLQGMGQNEIIGGIFAGPTGPIDPNTGAFVGPYADPNGIGEPYYAGYTEQLWRGLPFEDRVRLQDELVSLGLTSQAIPGEFDDGTIKGIERMLSLSNRSGTTWEATLGRLRDAEQKGLLDQERRAAFEPDPYLAPDHAYFVQIVRDQYEQALGREPEDSELVEFVAHLQGWDKQNFEVQQQAARAAHEGDGGGFSAEAIDPLARFQEHFNKVYSGELDIIEDRQESSEVQEITGAAIDRLSTMSRGEF